MWVFVMNYKKILERIFSEFQLTSLGETIPYIFLILATLALACRDLLTGDGLL